METVFQQGIDFILALQQLEWLVPIMRFFTFLGDEEFYLLVMPILIWAFDYRLGVRLGTLMLSSANLNSILKLSFAAPRPYWLDSRIKNLTKPYVSLSLPSGHAQNSAVLFGLIATSIRKRWLTIVMVFVIFMVGMSRIYLGVHNHLDVMLGWAVGGASLLAFLAFEDKVSAWFKSKSFGVQVGTVFLISLLIILIGAVIIALQTPFDIPQVWQTNTQLAHSEEPLHPFDIEGFITSSAALFGLALGSFWIAKTGGFNARVGAWWHKVLRILIGLAGVLVLWMGLGAIFPDNADLISYILRYLRYALTGAWMSGIAPQVFLSAKLGSR